MYPPLPEAGIKDATAVEWFDLFAPGKTPADIIAKLNKAVSNAASSPAFKEALSKGAFESLGNDSSTSFAQAVKADITR